jgi:hypothetical protein
MYAMKRSKPKRRQSQLRALFDQLIERLLPTSGMPCERLTALRRDHRTLERASRQCSGNFVECREKSLREDAKRLCDTH